MNEKPRDLKERTLAFARAVIRLYSTLPRDTVAQVLGKQVLRSGTSVGANYREASRGRSKAEFIAKVGDCPKKAEETDYWLELIEGENLLPAAKLALVRDETRQLIAILTTISKNAKGNS
jgi:four helix bundle protein